MSVSFIQISDYISWILDSSHRPNVYEANEQLYRSSGQKKGVDRLFPSTHREEISLLKILALAEVASDVNRATCSVHWARNISSPYPQKQARGACRNGYCYCSSRDDGGFKLKKEGATRKLSEI
jgi:hypothetical protein